MNELDGEVETPEEAVRFDVRGKCEDHHICKCKARKLSDAEDFRRREITALAARQALYEKVAGEFVEIYRGMNRMLRPRLREQLFLLYESIKDLGVSVGVSRASMPHAAEG